MMLASVLVGFNMLVAPIPLVAAQLYSVSFVGVLNVFPGTLTLNNLNNGVVCSAVVTTNAPQADPVIVFLVCDIFLPDGSLGGSVVSQQPTIPPPPTKLLQASYFPPATLGIYEVFATVWWSEDGGLSFFVGPTLGGASFKVQ